jgi:hypothetical protein
MVLICKVLDDYQFSRNAKKKILPCSERMRPLLREANEENHQNFRRGNFFSTEFRELRNTATLGQHYFLFIIPNPFIKPK